MPNATITPTPYQTALDSNGNPLSGALIYTYAAGTTDPATTYTDSTATVANTNPIVADSAGRWVAYLEPGQSYKFVVKTSAGVTVETQDNILATFSSAASSVQVTGITGSTLSVGDIVYLVTTGAQAGRWSAATNAAAASSTIPTLGVALNNTTPGGFTGTAAVTVALSGYTITTTGLTKGAIYYLGSTTHAQWTSTLPTTNVRVIGQAISTTELLFNPKPSTDVLGLSSSLNVGNQATTGTTGSLVITTDGAGVNRIESGTNLTAASAAPLVFTDYGASNEWMRITSDGKVGIGTNAPTQLLEVKGGNIHVTRASGDTNSSTINFYQNNVASNYGQWSVASRNTANGQFAFYNVGAALDNLTITGSTGNVAVRGALSKGSGAFRIDHPLPALKDTHQLVHSFIEGPQADLLYRGAVTLVNGTATVNLDTAAGMTSGTFVALCRDVQCFTSNESDWTPVRGAVVGNVLTITAQDAASTARVSWLVIGERHDPHMMTTDWTDANGKVIVEPLKPAPIPSES